MLTLPITDLESVASRTEMSWPNKKIFLITGGTGFFGRWIVESLYLLQNIKKSENRFIVISRQEPELLKKKIPVLQQECFTLVKQDLQKPFQLHERVDYVLHAASEVSALKSGQQIDFSSTVISTQNVINSLNLQNLKKFLYVSSGGVYSGASVGLSEDDFLIQCQNPDSYSAAKVLSEKLVKSLKLSCSARCFSFVGPFVDKNMAAMSMLNQSLTEKKIKVKSPDMIRSFMYPSDLVVALFTLLFKENKFFDYNVGSPEAVSFLDLAKKISFLNTSEVEVTGLSTPSLAGNCYFPKVERYNAEYGSACSVNLEEALIKTSTFLKQKERAT